MRSSQFRLSFGLWPSLSGSVLEREREREGLCMIFVPKSLLSWVLLPLVLFISSLLSAMWNCKNNQTERSKYTITISRVFFNSQSLQSNTLRFLTLSFQFHHFPVSCCTILPLIHFYSFFSMRSFKLQSISYIYIFAFPPFFLLTEFVQSVVFFFFYLSYF